MARAKRTDRAEARRRYRAETAVDDVDSNGEDSGEDSGESAASGDRAPSEGAGRGSKAAGRGKTGGSAARPTARMPLFAAFRLAYQVADVRSDLRALPSLIRGRSFLIPGALTLASIVVALVSLNSANVVASLLVTLFLGPLPIGSIYAAGVLAPRAAYLMGAIAAFVGTLGLIAVVMIGTTSTTARPAAADIIYALVFYSIFGAVIGAGLGFYRRLLRHLNPTPNRPPAKAKANPRGR